MRVNSRTCIPYSLFLLPVSNSEVRTLFNGIAARYDLLNHLLSGGIDLYWRKKAIAAVRDIRPKRILDVATGTADLALAAMKLGPDTIVGVDISENMLAIGREKIEQKGLTGTITLQAGEAEKIAFPDGSFDASIVAFGARNFENLEQGLREMGRVLRAGGRIMVLEFSRPSSFPFKQLYFFYFRRILPLIGRFISKDPGAYTYLPDTVMRFPEGEDFLGILRTAGFKNVRQERLTFGIATIYTGDT
ncbi:MAG: bifunctional demethylmenaquinone methyltransferase/2-methoxy-6-polyprenyl-1,4-benzoquinol methylase UbiE [Ignavibacteriae bacterium]|nr:bifunctional demethylmenaquinone methyltransferase/2-methoxy-6-polyprenyl-1,4-benzoquinol methylase UbiE [Ignavibacteriota bacterium]